MGREKKIETVEQRIHEQIEPSEEVKLLMTIPGVGPILGPVLWLEIGEVERFPRPEQLASYSGLVPRVIQSGQHMRFGSVGRRVNQHLKWAFVEAATCAVKLQCYRSEHIGRLWFHSANPRVPTRAGTRSVDIPESWMMTITPCRGCQRERPAGASANVRQSNRLHRGSSC